MSHPIPSLSVSPIYLICWFLLAAWLLAIAFIMWRCYRRARIQRLGEQQPWQVSRSEPQLLEGEIIRKSEESTPLPLAEPQPSRRMS